MTRPTILYGSVPIINSALGWDPGDDVGDVPAPVDQALDGAAFYPLITNQATFVQSDAGNIDDTTRNLALTPTPGDYMIAWVTCRSPGANDFTPPTGFTIIETTVRTSSDSFYWRKAGLAYRVVQTGDTGAVDCSSSFGSAAVMSVLTEWSGLTALDDTASLTEQSASTTMTCGGSVTTTASALIIGGGVVGGTTPTSGGDGATALTPASGNFELADMRNNNNAAPRLWMGYRIETAAGTYSVSATQDDAIARVWGGVTASFLSGTTTAYLPAPNTVDGDDATYQQVGPSTEALRIELGEALRIVRAELLIGTENSGAKSYSIYGSNDANFTTETLLDTVSFTGTGSYTAQAVTFTWTTTTAYQFYRLVGTHETRRIYSFELYEGTTDHGHTVEDLSDTTLTTLTVNDVLTWDGTTWVNRYNVARITSNTSNTVQGPLVNFASGSGITFAVSSNTLTIAASGTGTIPEADPVATQFGTPDTAYEFATSSLTGLTAIGSPTTEDANTTVPSALYYKDSTASIAWMGRYLASPSMPFTIITKVLDFNPSANYNAAGLLVGVADPATGAFVVIATEFSTNQKLAVDKFTNRTTYSSTFSTGINYPGSPVYLAAVVNSTTSIDWYWSMNGWVWRKQLTASNPSLTVGSVGLAMKSENAGGAAVAFDYLRIWNSAKTFI